MKRGEVCFERGLVGLGLLGVVGDGFLGIFVVEEAVRDGAGLLRGWAPEEGSFFVGFAEARGAEEAGHGGEWCWLDGW